MAINFNQPLLTLEGEPIIEVRTESQVVDLGEGRKEILHREVPVLDRENKPKILTLKIVCTRALTAMFKDEQALPAEEKVRRFTLAQKLLAGAEVEIEKGESDAINQVVGKMYPPLIVGQVRLMLSAVEKW